MKRHRFTVADNVHPLVRALMTECVDAGLSTYQLAEAAGVPVEAIANWYRGRSNPTMASLDKCFNALGYALTYGEAPSLRPKEPVA